MTTPNSGSQRFGALRVSKQVLFVTTLMSCLLGLRAEAASTESEYRLAIAGGKFNGTVQFARAFSYRSPTRFRADRLELAAGVISTSQETRPFVSLGPVWRIPTRGQSVHLEFGISPTLIAGSTFGQRDLGGNFHFTSSVALDIRFGERDRFSLSLRAQHTSNGGLHQTNPGMDMFGLSFSFNAAPR